MNGTFCSDACTLGKELQVPVYKFLEKPLIRKYGEDFTKPFAEAAEEWERMNLILNNTKIKVEKFSFSDSIFYKNQVLFEVFC